MSSAYNEAVKRVLTDINKFLTVTLKAESLSKNGQKEKTRVLDLLQDLFSKYDGLAPAHSDEGSASSSNIASFDESRNTTGSEEDGYSDSVADTTLKALTNPTKLGYLERKQKDNLLFSGWKKMYCVLHKNIFYFFKKPADKKQQGAFYITGYTAQEAPQNVKDASKKECSFELVCPGKRTYQFCADSVSDLHSWRDLINAAEPLLEEEGDEDDGDLYEPLSEVQGGSTQKSPRDDKSATTTDTSKTGPTAAVEEEGVVEEGDEDDLIYEPLEEEEEKKKSPPPPPKQPPHSAVPLPPIPGASSPKEKDSKGGEEVTSPPPLPTRSVGERSNLPPALPKRNVPPVPEIPAEKKMRTPTLGKLVHPSEDFENMFYGLYTCKGSSANELNFVRGDIIHVINRELDGEDWWIGELAGKIGLVPKSYLHPAYQIEF